MALPLTNLTLHCDASDTDKLFTTFDGGGAHSGTPIDGSAVQVWDDEGDGVANVCMVYGAVGGEPDYRSVTPLMLLPCLDYNGTTDRLFGALQAGGTKPISNYITASAFTLLVAFYAESITTSGAASYENHGVIGDMGGYFGLHLKNNGGTRQMLGYNYSSGDNAAVVSPILENTSYVGMVRHESGNLYASVNGGTEVSTVSGNTADLASDLTVGAANSQYYNGRIGEFAIWNVALTGSDLADAISYFTTKWLTGAPTGITASKALLGVGR